MARTELDPDSARDAVRALAAVRIGIGAGLYVAPTLAARAWIGPDAQRSGTRVMARGLGVRDVALGLGMLLARDDAGRTGWLEAGILADVGDAAATLAHREGSLPGRLATVSVALGAAAAGFVLRGQLAGER